MMVHIRNLFLVLILPVLFMGCNRNPEEENRNLPVLSDEALLNEIQYRTFQYFWDGAEPHSGAARERYHEDGIYPQNDENVIATGGTGFGIMAIIAGIEEEFITRAEGVSRLERIVGFPGVRRPFSRDVAPLVIWGNGKGEALFSKR